MYWWIHEWNYRRDKRRQTKHTQQWGDETRRARLITAYGCDMHLISNCSNILAKGSVIKKTERPESESSRDAVAVAVGQYNRVNGVPSRCVTGVSARDVPSLALVWLMLLMIQASKVSRLQTALLDTTGQLLLLLPLGEISVARERSNQQGSTSRQQQLDQRVPHCYTTRLALLFQIWDLIAI